MVQTLTVASSALAEGDVVLTHGMRVLLDSPVKQYEAGNGTVYACRGLVTNLDAVKAAGVVPVTYLRDAEQDEPRWTVQGNDLVAWRVERP